MWVIRAKRRKSKTIEDWSKTFANFVFAKTAFDALQAGLTKTFIKRHFTYFKIEKI